MDNDTIQQQIELTTTQKKAWKSLLKSIKQCEEANIYFYLNLDILGALNGDNVGSISSPCDRETPPQIGNTGDLSFPTVQFTDSFADDAHYVILK